MPVRAHARIAEPPNRALEEDAILKTPAGQNDSRQSYAFRHVDDGVDEGVVESRRDDAD